MCDKDKSKNLINVNSICSVIQLKGSNTVDFLNNLLISNLIDFKNNTFYYTALCNPKGRIIASMWINIINSDLVKLIFPKNLCSDLLNFFSMRKFRLKIDIQQTSDLIALDLISNKIHLSSINNPDIDTTQLFYGFMFAQNLPWIDSKNTEKFIPQHVNLDQHQGIMSFSKGCYPGQEIIARLKYLGKIKKRMKLLINTNKQALKIEAKGHQIVSPIIYNSEENHYTIQVITVHN